MSDITQINVNGTTYDIKDAGAGNVSHDDDASAGSAVPINADQLEGYTVNTLLKFIYPVGSVYLNINNTNPSTFITGTTWVLISSVALASEHVFGNGYSLTIVDGTDVSANKRSMYSYSGYPAIDKNTYGQTNGTSVSSASSSALTNYKAVGLISKEQADDHPEYSGLIADTITLYTWKRTA